MILGLFSLPVKLDKYSVRLHSFQNSESTLATPPFKAINNVTVNHLKIKFLEFMLDDFKGTCGYIQNVCSYKLKEMYAETAI